jgi:anti-anti-sigma factor
MAKTNVDGGARRLSEEVVVEVATELDVRGAEALWEELHEAIVLDRPVTLDMSDCQFMDSTGLTVVIRAARALRKRNRALVVFGASGQPDRVFHLTRVGENAGIDFRPKRRSRAAPENVSPH